MPSWKKVITSGSEASLSSLYTSGNITGSNLNITGTISGSTISGSFIGDGSNLTGVADEAEISGSWRGALSGSLNIISGSETSTGSFGRVVATTGSYGRVEATNYSGDGSTLDNVLSFDVIENGVAVTSDGSATLDISNIVFVTTIAGEVITYQ